jgi:hypothetical protein
MADKSKLGTEFPPFTYEVEKGKIAEFVMAISQKESKDQIDQIYASKDVATKEGYDDIVISPTFQTCFALWGGGGLMPMITGLGIISAGCCTANTNTKPIHPGDVITCKTKVVDMRKERRISQQLHGIHVLKPK